MANSIYSFCCSTKKVAYAAFIFSLVVSCSNEKTPEDRQKKYQVLSPIVADTTFVSEYVADIEAVQNIEIRAKVSGYLERIHIDEGSFVKKGQLLFSLNRQEYRGELLQAKAMQKSAMADAKVAQVDLENVKRLVAKKIVSDTELEIAEAKVEAFRAKIDEAKALEASANLKLSYADVRAPFDGVINRLPKKTGSLIAEGDLLTTISDSRQVFAYFNLPEKEYLDFVQTSNEVKHSEVQLLLANNTIHPHKGVIETMGGTIDKNTGNIAFRARFENTEGFLKHGSSGKVRLSKPVKNVLIVPQKSTFEIQEDTYVFVVDDENVVHMRRIVPQLRLSNIYVVRSGLTTQDKIVYEGLQHVREGEKIEVDQVQFRPILANVTGK